MDWGVRESIEKHLGAAFSAGATLLAATIAISGVLRSIEHQRLSSEHTRNRSLAAAKSTLSLALVQLSDICLNGIRNSLGISSAGRTPDELVAEIQSSPELLLTLKQCIEFADNASGDRLANLVRHYQVYRSRHIHALAQERPEHPERVSSAADWAVLFRLVEDCFDYAHGDAMDIPQAMTNRNLTGVFSMRLFISRGRYPGLEVEIERRHRHDSLELF